MKSENPQREPTKAAELFRRRKREVFPREKRGRAWTFFIQLFISLIIVGGSLALSLQPSLKRIEYPLLDLFFRLRPPLVQHQDIAVIEIADDGLEAIGRWPWPRHYHAVLIHLLREWGAKAVVFDILFSEPSEPFEDGAMEEALEKGPPVYFPVILEAQLKEGKWRLPIDRFESRARGLGHINVTPDRDGVSRRVPAELKFEDTSYRYLGLEAAGNVLSGLPLDGEGNLLINWPGSWTRSFKHYSYLNLVQSFYAQKRGEPPLIDPAELKEKICIVGLTATGHADLKATPMEAVAPGVNVLASVINSVLTRQFVIPASPQTNLLCLIGVGLAGILFLVPFRGFISFAGTVVVSAVWLSGAFILFWQKGIWLHGVQPLLSLPLLFIFSALYSSRVGEKERGELLQLAIRDGLTGLYVIRHFRGLLNEAVARARERKEPLSLILIDLDDFKRINDTYGHAAGDAALREVAAVIQMFIRHERSPEEMDSVARYGGEEFIVLLRNCSLENAAEKVAARLLTKVQENPFQYKGQPISVRLSAGVASLHEGESIPDPMAHRADQALYLAKQRGKNRVCSEKELSLNG